MVDADDSIRDELVQLREALDDCLEKSRMMNDTIGFLTNSMNIMDSGEKQYRVIPMDITYIVRDAAKKARTSIGKKADIMINSDNRLPLIMVDSYIGVAFSSIIASAVLLQHRFNGSGPVIISLGWRKSKDYGYVAMIEFNCPDCKDLSNINHGIFGTNVMENREDIRIFINLLVARSIIERFNGSMGMHVHEEKGATIIVEFPAIRPSLG